MTKRPFNQENNQPFDYFAEEKATKKQETDSAEQMINTLRSDMVVLSETVPTEDNFIQRINFKLVLGIFLAVIILGVLLFLIFGRGRPKLENSLEGLVDRRETPTQTLNQASILATGRPTQAINAPDRSVTTIPTKTQSMIILATPTKDFSKVSPTIQPSATVPIKATLVSGCREASSITLKDVGQSFCVQGVVKEIIVNPTNTLVTFSTAKGSFYWVTYDVTWSEGEVNQCYQLEGTIEQIASSPIMIFYFSNLPEDCP